MGIRTMQFWVVKSNKPVVLQLHKLEEDHPLQHWWVALAPHGEKRSKSMA